MNPIIIVTGNSETTAELRELHELTDLPPGSVIVDSLTDPEAILLVTDRTRSIDRELIVALHDEVMGIMGKHQFVPLLIDEERTPLGKSPKALRRGNKDWQVSSGRGLRR